jgi:hypothetical protein
MVNTQLYQAAQALLNAAKIVKFIDLEYSNELLNKSLEYTKKIKIDEKLNKEVEEFERKIKERL